MVNILTVCLNPVIQKTLLFNNFNLESVNRSDEVYLDASGKGINVTRILYQLGARVTHLTHTGKENKKKFLKLTREASLKVESVDAKNHVRSCYTLLNNELKTTTEVVEESKSIGAKCEKRLLKKFKSLLKNFQILVISGSKAKGYSKNIIPDMVKIAKLHNKQVILDIQGYDLLESLKFSPDVIKHNLDEFKNSFGTTSNMEDISRELFKNKTTLIVTDGIRPVRFFLENKLESKEIVKIDDPINTTGCGDAFTAGLSYSLSIGKDLVSSVDFAIKTASNSASCKRPGYIKDRL